MYTPNDKSIFFYIIGFTLGLLMLAFIMFALINSAHFVLSEFLLAAIPITIIGSGIAYFLAYKINQDFIRVQNSINQLVVSTEEITQGDFNKRLGSNYQGETRPLAEAFNFFVDKIATVIKNVSNAARNVIQATQKN
jgi:methyl-accepting chemotaxis protein